MEDFNAIIANWAKRAQLAAEKAAAQATQIRAEPIPPVSAGGLVHENPGAAEGQTKGANPSPDVAAEFKRARDIQAAALDREASYWREVETEAKRGFLLADGTNVQMSMDENYRQILGAAQRAGRIVHRPEEPSY